MRNLIPRRSDPRACDTGNDQCGNAAKQTNQLIEGRGNHDGNKNRSKNDGQRNGEPAVTEAEVKEWCGQRAKSKRNGHRDGGNERIAERPDDSHAIRFVVGGQGELNHTYESESREERANKSDEQENGETVCSSVHNERSALQSKPQPARATDSELSPSRPPGLGSRDRFGAIAAVIFFRQLAG
jgi:hypothetical protein